MIAFADPVRQEEPAPAWCEGFLAMLPAIRRQAHREFRYLRKEAREESVAECAAIAAVAYVALHDRGKVELAYPSTLGRYAAAQVRAGRRAGSRLNSREVLARAAQKCRGFTVQRLDRFDRGADEWVEAIIEDRRTPVPDQAAFRCDFPRWLGTLSSRDRRIAEALAVGHSTREVAERFAVSPARISQLRREFHESWLTYQGERDSVERGTRTAS